MSSESKFRKMDKRLHWGRARHWGKAGTKFCGISFFNGSNRMKLKQELCNNIKDLTV